MATSGDSGQRKHRRGLLKQYYSLSSEKDNNETKEVESYNINASHFNPEMYINKLLKECSLTELIDHEQVVYRQIQSLDSEMQTLVYENYNKFISATDTIRKMKNDFKKMEEEMDGLASNMATITDFSGKISDTLQSRRDQITKLTGVHLLLRKLQFLFELPPRLKSYIEDDEYVQAARYYTKAQKILLQYNHMLSFRGIQEDCTVLVKELKIKLRERFHSPEATPKQLAECVDLLLQLKEPAENLCEEFLSHSQERLSVDLLELERQVKLQCGENVPKRVEQERPSDIYMNLPDILEFVDLGCNSFLSNICLVIASYNDMFLNRLPCEEEGTEKMDNMALTKLHNFVMSLMEQYFEYVEQRVFLEKESSDFSVLVRALDRFHRRLQAMNKLLPDSDFSRTGLDIVSRAGKECCMKCLEALKHHFSECLTTVRHSLAASAIVGHEGIPQLTELLASVENSTADQVKSVLANLQAFTRPDNTFATKPNFLEPFCHDHVREGVIVAFICHINAAANEFCQNAGDKGVCPPPSLLLLLSRLCFDLEVSSIGFLLSLTDEQFTTDDHHRVTSVSELCQETKETAQKLLNHFVRVQGLNISQMLRKSVETRDWLNTIEPRNVRAVMKRVVEDLTAIDAQVGHLYEEGIRKERSSDSSRRTYPYSTGRQPLRSNWSAYGPSTIDTSLLSNIQKLFSERIEIFSTVEFSKVSVMTGIIKISLKTFLECVRLRTFSRYGLQQVQVDTHYLQLYFWRFVADENLIHVLLDEVLGSTLHRCLDPTLMDTGVVEVICDRG
ncbi:vacuolar protein sorting 51 isoform X2 [Tachypleus tridentatus]|uniref:vacuolar protein sorting 51 isoform X2 n=1 Tax=Tachypleus tridentatus TaxID=6853 RepID=UPI003FD31EF9